MLFFFFWNVKNLRRHLHNFCTRNSREQTHLKNVDDTLSAVRAPAKTRHSNDKRQAFVHHGAPSWEWFRAYCNGKLAETKGVNRERVHILFLGESANCCVVVEEVSETRGSSTKFTSTPSPLDALFPKDLLERRSDGYFISYKCANIQRYGVEVDEGSALLGIGEFLMERLTSKRWHVENDLTSIVAVKDNTRKSFCKKHRGLHLHEYWWHGLQD